MPPAEPTRQRICAEAFELFATHGYAGTKVRAVATAVGQSPGVITYYFPRKEDLFRAALEGPYQRMVAAMEAALSAPGLDARGRLVALLEFGANPGPESARLLRVLLRQMLESAAPLGAMTDMFVGGHIRLVMSTLAEAAEARVIDPTLAGGLAPIILGGTVLPRLLFDAARDVPAARTVVEMVASRSKDTLYRLLGLGAP